MRLTSLSGFRRSAHELHDDSFLLYRQYVMFSDNQNCDFGPPKSPLPLAKLLEVDLRSQPPGIRLAGNARAVGDEGVDVVEDYFAVRIAVPVEAGSRVLHDAAADVAVV